LLLLSGNSAFAQDRLRQPSITELDAALPAQAGTILPEYKTAPAAPVDPLTNPGRVTVSAIAISGNTILADELSAVAARYQGRDLSIADLRRLQDELSLVYVQRGYLTSGATLTSLDGAVLHVTIVEGRLETIRARSDGRYRDEYVASYLESFGELQPVNAFDLERRLQALQNEPHVESVDAQLLPGEQRGDSVLLVETHEAPPLSARLEVNNYQTPAVGAWGGRVGLGYHNPAGRGDHLNVSLRDTEGLWEAYGEYRVPINAYGTRVELFGSALKSEIVSGPFEDLDIKADSQTAGVKLVHPLTRDPANLSSISLTGEWWRSKTYLLGSGYSFVEGPDDGVGEAAVVRLGADWRKRSARSVLAGSVQVSVGLDALGATQAHGDAPDGQFVSAMVRAQWARRLNFLDSQMITRFDAQFADAALLGMEQMTLGGRWSIRGYRENTLIRDNGLIGSLEWRVPLWIEANGRVVLEVGPFVDLSYSWNTNRGEIGPKELRSVGLGMHWRPLDSVHFEVYWGEELDDIDYPGNDELQDAGVHMGLEVRIQ
jgi:hemolysin activation/secretion protein